MDRRSQRFVTWQDVEIALPSDLVAWRVLCNECEKFLERETQIVRASRKERLLADCVFDSTPSVARGIMLKLRRGPDELLKTQLETWATKAAIAIGCPRDEAPLRFWLCKLFVYLEKSESKHLFAPSSSVKIGDNPQSDLLKPHAGETHSSVGGIITNVWEASLNFSVWIEKQAVEVRRLIPPMHDPMTPEVVWPGNQNETERAKHLSLTERETTVLPRSWEELRKRDSISRKEAADYLRCGIKSVQRLVNANELKESPKNRLICNELLRKQIRNVHGNQVLP
jgi:hypothetical protein